MMIRLRHGSCFLALCALAALPLVGQQGRPSTERAAPGATADPDNDRELADAGERLAKIGYAVPAGIRSEARDVAQVLADLDAQQDLFMPGDSFELQHALLSGLGLPAGRDADALRQNTLASMARGLSAYYDPLRKVFVLLPSRTRDVAEAMTGSLLPLLAHELVHAHQDARDGGLAGLFGGEGRTLDSAMARRMVIEGEAELAALVAIGGEKALAVLDGGDSTGTLDSLFAGELTGRIYATGRRLAFARHRQGGFEAIKALWISPPRSCEEAMHPTKYGKDAPVTVTVPAVEGLTQARATTVGELLVFHVLRQADVDRLDAAVAAAGWDGDRLVQFDRGADRDVALVWRSVWDRDEDAADFAARLAARERGEVVHDGRVVDWVFAAEDELRARIFAACSDSRPQPAVDEDDSASTAAVEEEIVAGENASAIDGEFWRHGHVGLAVPIPPGWGVREINGVKMLLESKPVDGFALNVNVMILPRGPLADLDAMIEVSRAQLERMKLEVAKLEKARRGEVDVVLGEYSGRIGASEPMHFLLLMYLRGDQQVVVTVTSSEARWPGHGEELQRLLDGIRVAPR